MIEVWLLYYHSYKASNKPRLFKFCHMEDIRVLWIKCVIRNNFNLSSDVVFDDFLNRDARINEIKLIDFLDGRGSALYPSILFMTRRVRETIFEEVIIQLDSEGILVFSGFIFEPRLVLWLFQLTEICPA